MNYQKPKGTRDILPQTALKWQFMEEKAREVARLNNYGEIRTPTFEDSALYLRSVGDTSDIVSKEMYEFKDKAERNLALRPEGTAGVVRAVVENGILNEALPAKLYYFSNCFRYENTQKGRYREFSQFGLECFGAENPEADAELIIMVDKYLRSVDIQNSTLLLNSIGCPHCRAEFNKALRDFASKYTDEWCVDCKRRAVENPLRMLDCKKDSCQDILKNAPSILDYLCPECKEHFAKVQAVLLSAGVKFILDDRLVRGLDYYTKTVFEFVHEGFDGKTLTIAAGGRYDNLVEQIGGKSCPAIGVGIGLDRVVELVDESLMTKQGLLFVANMDDVEVSKIIPIATLLRNNGNKVEINLNNRSFKAQMKYANTIGAKYLIVVGQTELEQRQLKVKNLETGEYLNETIKF